MEQDEIKTLLEKYWRAETSLGEEQRLADYFRQAEAGPDLEPMRVVRVEGGRGTGQAG